MEISTYAERTLLDLKRQATQTREQLHDLMRMVSSIDLTMTLAALSTADEYLHKLERLDLKANKSKEKTRGHR